MERHRASQALRQSTELLARVISSAADAIITKDQRGSRFQQFAGGYPGLRGTAHRINLPPKPLTRSGLTQKVQEMLNS
jgi:hypothetical protein